MAGKSGTSFGVPAWTLEPPHEEEAETHNAIITEFSTWLVVVCIFVLAVVETVGLLTTSIDLYASFSILRKHHFKKTTLLSIFIMSLQLLPLYLVLIPMTAVGVLAPHVLNENFCYVHETLTYTVITTGFLAPAVSSLDKLDSVVNHGKRVLNRQRLVMAFVALSAFAICINVLPLFVFTESGSWFHHHGCHLWSSRVDSFVWFQIITLTTGLLLSCSTMVFAYSKIYLATRARVKAMETHKADMNPGPATVPPTTVSGANSLSVPSASSVRASKNTQQSSMGRDASSKERVRSKLNALHSRQQAHRKVAALAAAVVFGYIVFWMPWLVLMSNAMIQSEHNDHTFEDSHGSDDNGEDETHGLPAQTELRILALVFGYITAATDPLAFAIMSPHITAFIKEKKAKTAASFST